jgi:hypothetical protein
MRSEMTWGLGESKGVFGLVLNTEPILPPLKPAPRAKVRRVARSIARALDVPMRVVAVPRAPGMGRLPSVPVKSSARSRRRVA